MYGALKPTFQQQWLWEMARRYPQWNCVLPYAFRLSGELNVVCLRRSIEETIRRNVVLRTRLVTVKGELQQWCGPPESLDLPLVVCANDAEVGKFLRALFDDCAVRLAQPEARSLLRFQLVRCADGTHILALAIHRLIVDCFSVDRIFHELWSTYELLLQDEEAAIPAVTPQYADYAVGQQSSYDEWLKRHESYWNSRLAGALPLAWPSEENRLESRRGELGRFKYFFGEELSAQLRDLAKQTRTLCAVVMLAVYVAAIARWCGQKDLVIPFNVAGRQAEHKNVIGCFAHVLYLRMQLTGEETPIQVVNKLGNEFFRALSHQDFGTMAMRRPELLEGTFFQWISWHLDDAAGPSVPVTQTQPLVNAQGVPLKEIGVELSAMPPGLVALEASFFDTAAGTYASGFYRADLFSAASVERLMDSLRDMAERFVRRSAKTWMEDS